MVRYWIITPYHYYRPEEFDQCWHYDRNNGVIAIGWNLGNLSNLSVEAIRMRYEDEFPDEDPNSFYQVLKFWQEIQPGDRIIARAGRKRIIGLGTVQGRPYYSLEEWERRGRGIDFTTHTNFLPVRWDNIKEHFFPDMVFGIQTVTEITERSRHWPAVKAVLSNVWNLP